MTCKCGKIHRVDGRHVHWIGDSRATGVTTISGFCGDRGGLCQWYANKAVEFIKNKYMELDGEEFLKTFSEMLEEARYAAKAEKEEAAKRGTEKHKIIEGLLDDAIENDGYIRCKEHENPAIDRFVKWAEEEHIKFLASEMLVHHGELHVGGILDFLYERKGRKGLGDIKCRKAIYGTEFIQLGGYDLLLREEHGTEVEESVIVRLDKDDTEVKYSYDLPTWRNAFLGALTALRAYNSFKPNNGK